MAINKSEQAMDLVKNRLMVAVREKLEILKKQIRERMNPKLGSELTSRRPSHRS